MLILFYKLHEVVETGANSPEHSMRTALEAVFCVNGQVSKYP
jgi:hypothetical protein